MTKGKRLKVVRFLISPNKKKVKIEVNKIMKTVIRPPHVGSCHQRNRRAVLILREEYVRKRERENPTVEKEG